MGRESSVSPGARFLLIFVFLCGALSTLVGLADRLVPDLPWVVLLAAALCAAVAGVAGGLADLIAKLKRAESRGPALHLERVGTAAGPTNPAVYRPRQVTGNDGATGPAGPGTRTNWVIATVVSAIFTLGIWFLFPIPIITGLVAARRTKAAWLVAIITTVTIVGGTLLLVVLGFLSGSMSY